MWEAPKPFVEHKLDFGRPVCDWNRVKEGILDHGKRNSCDGTFAPTGTIATTAGVEGYGCESIFALLYSRTVMQEEKNIILQYPSGLFAKLLTDAGIDEATQFVIGEKVAANNGSCQGIAEVPQEIQNIMVVSADLTGREHVRMQAVLQAFVDNSISKTINFANTATVEDVADAYMLAWKTGCKGITIYRQGSRELEVLSTKPASATGTVEVVDPDHWPIVQVLPIPAEAEEVGLPSRTYSVRTPFGKMRSTVTSLESHPGRPFDVSLSVGKGGNDVNAFAEGLARVASLALRAGVSKDEIADQLIGIGGSTQERTLRPDKALSVPDAFGKLLRDYGASTAVAAAVVSTESDAGAATITVEKVHNPGLFCPDCKLATVAVSQGCMTCMPELGGCGWSKCP